jgi:two-component system sensor histidine kinase CpxA
MRSLLVRIFISFWAIIVITIMAAGGLGYLYAERARSAMQNFEVSDAMLEASAALRESGREGLTEWLRELPGVTASLVFVLDDRGQDLLDRRLPPPVVMAVNRFGGPGIRRSAPPREFGNLRPARPFTQLVGPDGHVYTLFVLPAQGKVGRWLAQRGGATVILLALLISGVVSYLLARTISNPIRRFRESAIAIGEGKLDTRVADRVGPRRDEIGLLAQDFDRMTDDLQRAWQRQTELTRNVSHELRSPLARMRVALELARRKVGDAAEFEKIEAETERLDELIGQIIVFSRLDADEQEEPKTVDLDEMVSTVIEDLKYEFGHVSVDYECDSQSTVVGYPGALRSAIENVLRNAARHGGEHGCIEVILTGDSAQAVLTVEDQGGGVPAEHLKTIFEPFFRSNEPGDREVNRGSGLGLAIAARAVALNGGTVVARNGERGLCVELRLPTTGAQSRV